MANLLVLKFLKVEVIKRDLNFGKDLIKKTDIPNLCLAGGVHMNCKLNGVLANLLGTWANIQRRSVCWLCKSAHLLKRNLQGIPKFHQMSSHFDTKKTTSESNHLLQVQSHGQL